MKKIRALWILAAVLFSAEVWFLSLCEANDEDRPDPDIQSHFIAFNRYGVKHTVEDCLFPPYGYQPAFPLNNMQKKAGLRFTSPKDGAVRFLWLYARMTGAPGTVKVSLKDDNGGGKPVKDDVPESTLLTSATGWIKIRLDVNKDLSSGAVYHIVIEPHSGAFGPNDFMETITAVSRQPIPFQPFLETSPVKSYEDMKLGFLFDRGDGNGFQVERGYYIGIEVNAFHPIFVVELDDETAIGQPYNAHEHHSISGNHFYGQALETKIPFDINYVVLFTSAEGSVRPSDHLWLDIYYDNGGVPVPVLQDLKLADKNGYLFAYRAHWFGVNLPSPITLQSNIPYYFVLKSPGSASGEAYLFPRENSTIPMPNPMHIPTYHSVKSYGIHSSDGGATFNALGTSSDTGLILDYLTGGDEARPIAVFDEIFDFPLTAEAGAHIDLRITNRNIGEDGDIYIKLYDFTTLSVLGNQVYPDVPRNREDTRTLSITMPGKDLFILVECGHYGPGDAEVPDDYVPLEIGMSGDQGLTADLYSIPASSGGIIHFSLDAGVSNGGRHYILLGSYTGAEPGTALPHGGVTLPLNWDLFTNTVIDLINTPVFSNFLGTLDGEGQNTAHMTFSSLPPGAAGLTLYFAFALNAPWDFASNPVHIDIVP